MAHDATGHVVSGAVADLADAFASGRAIKIGVSGLCEDLAEGDALDQELFVEIGSGYYYTEQQLFIAGSHPVVRVRPAMPMTYTSQGWDSGWLVLRTDGSVIYRRCGPYTLTFDDHPYHCAIRWFVS